jgi:hypothetical protein
MRIVTLCFATVLAIAMVGCGKSTEPTTQPTTDQTAATTQPQAAPVSNQAGKTSGAQKAMSTAAPTPVGGSNAAPLEAGSALKGK